MINWVSKASFDEFSTDFQSRHLLNSRSYWSSYFSIITQVIIEICALSLVKNGVVFHYIHLRLIFKVAASHFVNVSEEEII